MIKQNEKTYLEAINYETVVRATGAGEAKAVSYFRRLREWCNTSESIGKNIEAYKFITLCSEKTLFSAQTEVLRDFEKLSRDTVIITNKDEYWQNSIENTLFLYLKGDVSLLKEKSISIVGTRHPTERGVNRAKIVSDVLGEKFVLTSGLARGIDGVVHIESLGRKYKTIAVIGTPIDSYYPPEHEQLQNLIAERGLLVSEFGPGRIVQPYFFIQRNFTMASVSFASFVIESGDGGGGVKQAKYTEKLGKDVFILKDVYDDSAIKWPKEFNRPVLVPEPSAALDCVLYPEKYRAVQQSDLIV